MVIVAMPVISRMAALLTRISQRPCRALTVSASAATEASSPMSTRAAKPSTSDAVSAAAGSAMVAVTGAGALVDVGDDHRRALACEPLGDCLSDAARRTGYQRHAS